MSLQNVTPEAVLPERVSISTLTRSDDFSFEIGGKVYTVENVFCTRDPQVVRVRFWDSDSTVKTVKFKWNTKVWKHPYAISQEDAVAQDAISDLVHEAREEQWSPLRMRTEVTHAEINLGLPTGSLLHLLEDEKTDGGNNPIDPTQPWYSKEGPKES